MLTDIDKMPFGKYTGALMQDIPVHYLHYLWCKGFNKIERDKIPTATHQINSYNVAMYIRDNLNALKMEDKDKLW